MAHEKSHKWIWQVGLDVSNLEDGLGRVARGAYWQPKVDVMELADRLVLRAELPGVRMENIGLLYNLDRHTIVIRGHREDELLEEAGTFHQMEVPFGEFQRTISLPTATIDPEGIRSQYKNGFLYVVLPKRPRIFVKSVTIQEI